MKFNLKKWFVENIALFYHLANKWADSRNYYTADDAVSDAYIGCVSAAKSLDTTKCGNPAMWFYNGCRGYIKNHNDRFNRKISKAPNKVVYKRYVEYEKKGDLPKRAYYNGSEIIGNYACASLNSVDNNGIVFQESMSSNAYNYMYDESEEHDLFINDLLKFLSVEEKRLLHLYYKHGHFLHEIADMYNVRHETIRLRIKKIIQKIRDHHGIEVQ